MDISLIRAKVGMIFQKPTPFPMSIYDNIAFGVRLFEKLSKEKMNERVEWALTKAALWNEVKINYIKAEIVYLADNSNACALLEELLLNLVCCCSMNLVRH